jgi:uncharacterized protein YecT (DUF1311 family)
MTVVSRKQAADAVGQDMTARPTFVAGLLRVGARTKRPTAPCHCNGVSSMPRNTARYLVNPTPIDETETCLHSSTMNDRGCCEDGRSCSAGRRPCRMRNRSCSNAHGRTAVTGWQRWGMRVSRTASSAVRYIVRDGGVSAKMRVIVVVLVAVTVLPPPGFATDMFGEGYKPCGDKVSTVEIVDCTTAKTKAWDARLNTAYAALQRTIEPGQREPLRTAQRLWIQYRGANCGFYGAQSGTIRQVQAAECVRAMTQDRALELEQAARP